MKAVQVKILPNSQDKETVSRKFMVPAELNLALEKNSNEINIDFLSRLKLDMQMMINGEEIEIDSLSDYSLEDGDRIVLFPGIGGG